MSPLATFTIDGQAITLRSAVAEDVPAIVALLADDHLGRARERVCDGDLTPYREAFVVIDRDPTELLLVATAQGRVIATSSSASCPASAVAARCGRRSRPSASGPACAVPVWARR